MEPEKLEQELARLGREIRASSEAFASIAAELSTLRNQVESTGDGVPQEPVKEDVTSTLRLRPEPPEPAPPQAAPDSTATAQVRRPDLTPPPATTPSPQADPDSTTTAQVRRPDLTPPPATTPSPQPSDATSAKIRETLPLAPLELPQPPAVTPKPQEVPEPPGPVSSEFARMKAARRTSPPSAPPSAARAPMTPVPMTPGPPSGPMIVDRPPALTPAHGTARPDGAKRPPRETQNYPFSPVAEPPPGSSAAAIDDAMRPPRSPDDPDEDPER